MRLFKPIILILVVLLLVLFTFIIILFYKLSLFQSILTGNINLSESKDIFEVYFRNIYIYLSIISSISIITLLFFLLI